MKYKKLMLLYTTIIISCSSTLSFANQIKTIKQDNSEYIPLEEIVKKAGGSFNKVNNEIDIKIDSKTISLSSDNSFVKINERYHPIQTTEINGFTIPQNKKIIEKGNKVYIQKDFLKNQKIIDYKVENNIVTINSSTNIQTSMPNIQVEEENNNTQQTTQTRPNNNNNTSSNRPNTGNNNNNTSSNRPNTGNNNNSTSSNRPNTGNNNNSTSSNRPNTGNNNNNISNNRPTTENNSSNNNSNSNSNSGNTQEPPIIQDTEQPTPPETPSDSPLGDSSSEEVSENITE